MLLLRLIGSLSGPHLLTQSDTVDLGPQRVRQVPVNLLYDLLLHLWDGVTVQHLDGRHIWTLALDQHLQRLAQTHTHTLTRVMMLYDWHVQHRVHLRSDMTNMQKYSNMARTPSHPPTRTKLYWDVVVMATGFCKTTHTQTHTHSGDTWQDSCHLDQLMTTAQRGQARPHLTSHAHSGLLEISDHSTHSNGGQAIRWHWQPHNPIHI